MALDFPAPTDSELRATAISQRDALLSSANEKTAGMSYTYIIEILSHEDAAVLKSYVIYKLALNKIDVEIGYPVSLV